MLGKIEKHSRKIEIKENEGFLKNINTVLTNFERAVKLLPWIPEVFSLARGEERPSKRVVRLHGFAAQFCRPNEKKKPLALMVLHG